MTIACPQCNGIMWSDGIRKTASGGYRRMICRSCRYHEKRQLDGSGKLPPGNRKFNAQQIREILGAEGTLYEIGQRFGCHRETVRQIRAGMLYKDLLPYGYLPKNAAGPRCDKCIHWRVGALDIYEEWAGFPKRSGACSLGFPDPAIEGHYFARDCAAWVEKKP